MHVRSALGAVLLSFLPALAGAAGPALPEAAPGQVLVRFNDGLGFCAETAFAQRGTVPALEGLFSELQVTGVEAVFRSSEETLQLAAGRSVLSVEALRQAHRRKTEQLLAGRPQATGVVPELFHVYRFQLAPGQDAAAAASRLARDPRVIYAEPNHLYTTSALPNDRFVDDDGDGEWEAGTWGQEHSDLWGHEFLGWELVWERQNELWTDPARIGGGGVTVAVVDTGVDVDHPDLAANVWRDGQGRPGRDTVDVDLQAYLDQGFGAVAGEDYADPDFEPQDLVGHGTHVAGTVAAVADNGVGIAGIAWGSRLMAVRAGFALQVGSARRGVLEADDVAAALVWAADQGADVVNMSFGGSQVSETIGLGVDYLVALGVLPIASAGNGSSPGSVDYPGSHPGVLAVGSLDPLGKRSPFSDHGPLVSLAAPGTDVLSLRARNTTLTTVGQVVQNVYIRSEGTSMAAPHVAGTAALALSAHPALSGAELRRRLEGSSGALDVTTYTGQGSRRSFGYGAPDPFAAVAAPAQPSLRLLLTFVGDQPNNGPDSAGNNGNGLAEAGELIRLSLTLRNVWRDAAGPVDLSLSSPSPFVRVTQGAFTRDGWPAGLEVAPAFNLRVAGGAPPLQTVPLVLDAEGDGWSQRLSLSLALNPPAPFPVRTDRYDIPEDDANVAPVVLADEGGGATVVWLRQLVSRGTAELLARRMGPDGELLGEEILLHRDEFFALARYGAGSNGRGRLVATWEDRVAAGGFTLRASLLDLAGGVPSPPVEVYQAAPGEVPSEPVAAVAPDGSFTVAWGLSRNEGSDVLLRRYSAEGLPLGPATQVDTAPDGFQSNPALAYSGGELIVVWRQFPGIHVVAQRFDGAGAKVGGEIIVDEEASVFGLTPKVAPLGGGGFLAAWDNCLPSTVGRPCTLRARGFDGEDRPLAGESTVSEQPGITSLSLQVAATDARAALAWDACPLSLVGCKVRYRALEPSGLPAGEVLEVATAGESLFPGLAPSGKGFTLAWDTQDRAPTGVFGQVVKDPRALAPCDPASFTELCLGGGRFRVKVDWRHPNGDRGAGQTLPLSNRTGAFWFFRPGNVELVVKVLDGRPRNDHWWVFYASLSNVEYTLTVTDTETGAERTYENPPRTLASVGDTFAFPVLPVEPGGAPLALDPAASEGGPGLDPNGAALSGRTSRLEGGPGLDPGGFLSDHGAGEAEGGPSIDPAGSPVHLENAGGAGSSTCTPSAEVLCLQDGRFAVELAWATPQGGSGAGQTQLHSDDSGYFTFFNGDNVEVIVKVLDGRPRNGRWWVFYGSLSNVEYTLTVTDTETGAVKTYTNPQGTFASAADTQAF